VVTGDAAAGTTGTQRDDGAASGECGRPPAPGARYVKPAVISVELTETARRPAPAPAAPATAPERTVRRRRSRRPAGE
jgi:hypothetical protein